MTTPVTTHVDLYAEMLEKLHAAYLLKKQEHGPALFVVDPGPLMYPEFIDGLPEDVREEHNCRACADFIERTGHQVFISADGEVIPAYWDHTVVPAMYKPAVKAIQKRVAKGSIMFQLFTDREVIGTAYDTFPHFHLKHECQACIVETTELENADQSKAFSREDHRNLLRSLFDFNITILRQVKHLLDNDQIPNGQIIADRLNWLIKIQIDLERAVIGNGRRKNIIWRYVAEAPAGWCAVRGSILGKMLRSMKEGEELETIIAEFAERAKAENYMRATAAPTEGNLNRAEKIIASLDLKESLERRYAALDEVPTIWSPAAEKADAKHIKGAGVFDALRSSTKRKKPVEVENTTVDIVTVTFAKFRDKVLPNARKLEMYIVRGNGPFAGCMTAVHPDANPILQWDADDQRNPLSLYAYNGGSAPEHWGLTANTWVEIKGIMLAPYMMHNEQAHSKHPRGALLILDGARDSENTDLALFANTLRAELHEIRTTIEAYSNSATMGESPEGQLVQGFMLNDQQKGLRVRVRVTTDLGSAIYLIDRWD